MKGDISNSRIRVNYDISVRSLIKRTSDFFNDTLTSLLPKKQILIQLFMVVIWTLFYRKMVLLFIPYVFLGILLLTGTADAGSFNNNPGNVDVHENEDNVVNLWTIDATCTITYSVATTTSCYLVARCSSTRYVTTDVACDSCTITSNGGSVFQMSGSLTVQKKTCSNPGCGPTCTASGCLNAGTYTATVQCTGSHASLTNNGAISNSFTLTATQNAAPTFSFSSGNLINVNKSEVSVGSVVNQMMASDSDASVDGDSIVYSLISGPRASWINGNTLFELSASGEIKVRSDLSMEFSYTFTMVVTVHDRREDTTTGTLSISLHACYETPTCTGQTNTNIIDTHGSYTGHGTTDTLFNMIYPQPTDHFPDFRATWLQLQWTHTWTLNSHSNIAQDYYTGEIYSTGNISIFPSYPTKSFTMEVTVGNQDSCHTTTCTIDFTVHYTNWDIEMVNLDGTRRISEDRDDEFRVMTVKVFDYNFYWEDNVTCQITSITPDEQNMFEIRNDDNGDGTYAWNSWEIWRLVCQEPLCGYKYPPVASPFQCRTDIGCFTHNITQVYYIGVRCVDAYGSSTTGTLTVRIIQNQAPVYSNLPQTITLDTDTLAHYDTVYEIQYSDNEGESLIYEYTYSPDHGWFLGTPNGNYFDSMGNITMTVFLWNLTTNETHTVQICGHERRNEVCKTLTIQLRNNCGTKPACADQTRTVTEEFAANDKLFDVDVTTTHTSCTYSYSSNKPEYFSIDTSTGAITTTQLLDVGLSQETYTVVAFVYHSGSCQYASCSHTIYVDPVNYAISISNLDASTSILEDTTSETTLYQLVTSDANSGDDVICDVTTISPAQPADQPDLFFEEETLAGSDVYVIKSRASPNFTSAVTEYQITVECTDVRGSTATGTLTVNIQLNQEPVINNLNTSITKDPFSVIVGEVIHAVDVTDPENDAITYTCTTPSTLDPFECSTIQSNYILLRRTVDFVDENNIQYTITVCVGDVKHPSSSCGTLTVLFVSSVAYPSITNLPASQSVQEDTAIHTSIFQLTVSDADTGDVHNFLLISGLPSGAVSNFLLNTTSGVLYTAATLNYEITTEYSLTFSVKDQTLRSPSYWDLTITITNANEPPVLTASTQTVTFSEDTTVGSTLYGGPTFTITDQDVGDGYSLSISGTHASYFSLTPYSGIFTLATVWDLEASLPYTTTVIVTCTDSGGLTDTVNIIFNITAVNEFNPTVVSTYPLGTRPQISSSTDLTSQFLIVDATDQDRDDDGVFDIAILQPDSTNTKNRGSIYFFMQFDSGSTSRAVLKLSKSPDFTANVSIVLTVTVSDGESSPLHTYITMTFDYTASGETVPSKPTKCLTCTSTGRFVIAVLCIEAVILAGFIGHCIWNFWCRGSTPSSTPTKPKRVALSDLLTERLSGNGSTPNKTVSTIIGSTTLVTTMKGPKPQKSKIEISDTESSNSDSDDSVDSSNSRIHGLDEVGRTGFSFKKTAGGLPAPLYSSRLNADPHGGLPKPVYSSNHTASRPQGPAYTERPSKPSKPQKPATRKDHPPNPFSNPGMFRPNYA